jgi:hypothetical protein
MNMQLLALLRFVLRTPFGPRIASGVALAAPDDGTGGGERGKGGEEGRNSARVDHAELARRLGFVRTNNQSHGQPVYRRGNRYITPDVDSHRGGVWKMADSVRNLGSRRTRMGTYDADLNRIGD